MIRVLIVDDEPLARMRVRLMLAHHSDIEVVAECSTGREAIEVAAVEHPSLLFVDVEMPDLDGFEMLAALPRTEPTAVVYFTAHSEFALQAFEANAVDYLVKPFSQERFDRAVHRARRLLGGAATMSRVISPDRTRHRERFAVRMRGQVLFVKTVSIDWIAAESNYARLYIGQQSYLIRESLQALEEVLDPALFVRVHRSAIVNIERVRCLVPGADGSFSIVLVTEAKIPLGPTYRERLENVLGLKL